MGRNYRYQPRSDVARQHYQQQAPQQPGRQAQPQRSKGPGNAPDKREERGQGPGR